MGLGVKSRCGERYKNGLESVRECVFHIRESGCWGDYTVQLLVLVCLSLACIPYSKHEQHSNKLASGFSRLFLSIDYNISIIFSCNQIMAKMFRALSVSRDVHLPYSIAMHIVELTSLYLFLKFHHGFST